MDGWPCWHADKLNQRSTVRSALRDNASPKGQGEFAWPGPGKEIVVHRASSIVATVTVAAGTLPPVESEESRSGMVACLELRMSGGVVDVGVEARHGRRSRRRASTW